MKIFGIGLSKTGLHSITQAMKELGYTAKRYPTSYGEVEEYDFLCDSFIFTRFKDLSDKYPRAKFILTTRDEKSWLASCIKHLERRPIEELSDYSKERRIEAWGSISPSKQDFLDVYKRHNNEVLSYFQEKKEDLLIMDIVAGNGWDKLCKFLDKPVPDVLFPKLNIAP